MPIHKIAVISDTHEKLREEAKKELEEVEVILHCGDMTSKETFDELNKAGNLYAVEGNCDKKDLVLPDERLIELFGKKIYMTHIKKNVSEKAEEADIILYGHSHKYSEEIIDNILWLNPGSGGPKRFGGPVTMAILEIDSNSGDVNVRKIDLA